MRSLPSLAMLTLFGLCAWSPSATTASEPRSMEHLSGEYRNLAPDGGRSAIEEGVDRGLSGARPLVRAMARPRILDSNPPVERLVIEVERGVVRIRYVGHRVYRGRLGGRATTKQQAPNGGEVRVRFIRDGSALVEIAESDDGAGRTRYEREGDELRVQSYIESRHLPDPIRFEMRFERVR